MPKIGPKEIIKVETRRSAFWELYAKAVELEIDSGSGSLESLPKRAKEIADSLVVSVKKIFPE